MEHKPHLMRLIVNKEPSQVNVKGLYIITDHGEKLADRVNEALAGGASFLQHRNKEKDRQTAFAEGFELKQLCEQFGATFIVNDDLELAKELDADGVHLGQGDASPAEARQRLGADKIIGVSTHNLSEALQAEADGADYIGFGAMYPTASKAVEQTPGPEALAELRSKVNLPIVAIGGINRDNAARLIDAGADAVAVISAVLGAPDPYLSATEIALLFNRTNPFTRGSVLTVAGSDSGGGAGIQADIKTIALLGSYASSVVTALTAQNTRGVDTIYPLPASFVTEQMEAVLSDIPTDVVKTGMLFSAETIEAVAEKLLENRRRLLVADPVMIAKGGTHLMDREAADTFAERLIPITYMLTPNIPEAERLTGLSITDEDGMREAACAIFKMGAKNVLVKGGHLPSGDAVDILFDGSGFRRYPTPRIFTNCTHGTGCTYASAIAAFLAQGEPLPTAVARAKEFITSAIRLAKPFGKGHGPVNHFLAAKETCPKV